VEACILWIAAAAFTFLFMFSLNTRLARTQTNSSLKESLLDFKRWAARHAPRLVVLTAALLCFLLARHV
jgi:Na+/melibiose symporter-like transporter